jgi:hypothetical protein
MESFFQAIEKHKDAAAATALFIFALACIIIDGLKKAKR